MTLEKYYLLFFLIWFSLILSNSIQSNAMQSMQLTSSNAISSHNNLYHNHKSVTYYGKIRMLRRYTLINKEIVSTYPSVSYIDMRQAFLEALPNNYYGYMGCLTIDGEHENENGSIIVAKMFSDQLLSWLLMFGIWDEIKRRMGLQKREVRPKFMRFE